MTAGAMARIQGMPKIAYPETSAGTSRAQALINSSKVQIFAPSLSDNGNSGGANTCTTGGQNGKARVGKSGF